MSWSCVICEAVVETPYMGVLHVLIMKDEERGLTFIKPYKVEPAE